MGLSSSSPPVGSTRFVLLLAAALALAAPAPSDAQYFGRNKVLWEDFDFHVFETEHFRIHYYPAGNPAIADVARMAERWYGRLARAFDVELSEKKPLIFYNTHADFQQTTVTGGLIGEGTGGFTEPLQNRVVLPFTGLYSETDHVLGHELVHAFQFDILQNRDRRADAAAPRLQNLPLWMIEGLAEYFSQGHEDSQTALWLRDALLHERLPDLWDLGRGRYSPYQYGQAFWAYVGGRWGDDKVRELFLGAGVLGIEEAIRQVLGTPPEEVIEGWHAAVHEAYDPVLAGREAPAESFRPLLSRERTRARLNVAPALSPDGRRIAFLSTRGLFTIDLFLADAETGEVTRKLVSAASDPHFDALRFLDSAGAWSPDGRSFAFVVFERGDNRLSIVDVETGRVERRIEVPGVGGISSPAWSPDGRRIAFSGAASDSGLSDIYLLEVETGAARKLTDDPWGDLQPAWSPDGGTLAWVTEEPVAGTEGLDVHPVRIALREVAGGDRRLLSASDVGLEGARWINPQFSPDGTSLYFIADPEGVPDVFRYRLADGGVDRVTRVKTGVSGITDLSPALSVAARSGRLAFSALEDGHWNVYALDEPEAALRPLAAAPGDRRAAAVLPPGPAGEPAVVAEYLAQQGAPAAPAGAAAPARSEPYDPNLRLSYLGPPAVGVGVDRYGLGYGGSISAYFSDPLGEHQVGVAFQGGASQDLGTLFGGGVSYLNRQHRITWGASALHVPYISARTFISREPVEIDGDVVLADVVSQVRETVTVDEVAAVGHYPFSLTRRLEASVGYTHYSFDAEVEQLVIVGNTVVGRDIVGIPSTESFDFTRAALAYVGDRSFFGFVSPVRGTRYRFEVESSFGDLEFQTGLADYRRYFFFRPWTIAVRGMHYGRYGSDAEDPRLSPLYLGYGTLVRGYELDDFDGSECTPVEDSSACPEFDRLIGSRIGIVNVELRFPLLGTEEFGLFQSSFLPLELAVFADAGAAWTDDESVELEFDQETLARVPVVSVGVALRTAIGGFLPLQLYYAVPFQRPEEEATFGFVIAPGW